METKTQQLKHVLPLSRKSESNSKNNRVFSFFIFCGLLNTKYSQEFNLILRIANKKEKIVSQKGSFFLLIVV